MRPAVHKAPRDAPDPGKISAPGWIQCTMIHLDLPIASKFPDRGKLVRATAARLSARARQLA
jgi:hypothetical protein